MAFRFIHASDLHIGRKFANIPQPPDGNIRGRLMEARHAVIGKLAEAARSRGAAHVLLAGDTFVFALPGSNGAVKDGWDKILKDQLDSRHRPCNFVELMPRLLER